MRVLFSQSSHPTSFRLCIALLLACFISGCASIDVGGPKATKNDPAAGTLTLPDGSEHQILPSELNYSGPATYTYPDGRELKMRTSWVITGPDSWRQISEAVAGPTTQHLWSIEYTRMPLDYGPTPLSEN